MKGDKLLAAFCETTWGMERSRLLTASHIVLRHCGYTDDATDAPDGDVRQYHAADDFFRESRQGEAPFARRGSVAIIPVTGVLAKRASSIDEMSGARASSYAQIEAGLRAAAEAKSRGEISSALLFVDSPGGSMSGVFALAQLVHDLDTSGDLPIETFGDDLMASAAYLIGSQARRVSGSKGIVAGSIGVYTVIFDISGFHESQGVKVHLIASGEYKGAGTMGPPVTDAHLESIQAEVAKLQTMFVTDVERGRDNMNAGQVAENADGRVWLDDDSVTRGLVDELTTVDLVLERMQNDYGSNINTSGSTAAQPGGHAMSGTSKGGETTPAKDSTGQEKTGETNPAPLGGPPSEALGAKEISEIAAKAATDAIVANSAQAAKKTGEIETICGPFVHVDGVAVLKATALQNPLGCDIKALSGSVLEAVAKCESPTGSIIRVGEDGASRREAGIETILLGRAIPNIGARLSAEGGDDLAVSLGYKNGADYRQQEATARSAGLARISLMRLAEECARGSTGQTNFNSDDEVIAAAMSGRPHGAMGAVSGHSTGDFPGIMSNLANKRLIGAFAETKTKFDPIVEVVNMTDFKVTPTYTFSEAPDLLLTPEGGTPERADFNERAETNKLDTYTREFVLTRQMVINDDLGAFLRIPALFGAASARVPDVLVFALLNANPVMADGVALFHADHNNLGAGAALSNASLQAALDEMSLQQGFGESAAYLDVEGKIVLVPTGLRAKAKKIRDGEFDTTSGNADEPNTLRGTFSVVDTPRLTPASGPLPWFVFADPAQHPTIQVGFLNGQRTPQINRIMGGSALSTEFEIIFDAGVAAVGHEGARKNPGA